MAFSQDILKEENRFIERVRFPNGENVNLAVIQDRLQNECDSKGIPVAFNNNTIKTGSLFRRELEDVLVLYNTKYPDDYIQFLIRITHQGTYAFMDVFKIGGSKNFNNVGSSKIYKKLTGFEQKLEEEENFYVILADCMQNILS